MSQVVYEDKAITLEEGESALEGLLRSGVDIPNSCRAGLCQSCIVAVDPSSSAESDLAKLASFQPGLSDAQVALNQVLACQCVPREKLALRSIDASGLKVDAKLVEKTWLNQDVVRLRFAGGFDYKSGQYATLWKDQNVARSYSLASNPATDGFLEFHVKCIQGGSFSDWACNELEVGESVGIQGPLGKCFYGGSTDRPLLLSAIGTGLAPILGILKTALSAGHTGDISIVIGGQTTTSFYLVDELVQIAKSRLNVSLVFVALDCDIAPDLPYGDLLGEYLNMGDIYNYCADSFKELKGYGVFLCGAESFVKKMRRQCFMAGASMQDIHADAFVQFTG